MRITQDTVLGLLAICFGLTVIFLWAPIDTDSGIAEKIRGRWSIGDAFAPTVAGIVILASGIGVAVAGLRTGETATLTLSNLMFLVRFVGIIAISFAVIRYAGPVFATLAGLEYRPLRDTVPWKYIGFVLGGGGMIFALISLIERKFSWRRLALALAIALGMALIYDLPFEDLVLPPNGDV